MFLQGTVLKILNNYHSFRPFRIVITSMARFTNSDLFKKKSIFLFIYFGD